MSVSALGAILGLIISIILILRKIVPTYAMIIGAILGGIIGGAGLGGTAVCRRMPSLRVLPRLPYYPDGDHSG